MPQYESLDWYDNALYYDIIFDVDTAREADFLVDVHRAHGRSDGIRALEPACGSGRLVAALADRGYDVTGFDANPAMLRFARQRLRARRLRARLRQDRLESFTLSDRFDLAHCLVSTFKYLLDDASARAHLRRVARALLPGGLYVLGVHLTDYADRARSRERWIGDRDGVGVICNIQSWPPDRRERTERVRSRLIVRDEHGERRFETHWTFRTYSLRQLRTLLRSAPRLEHVATYDFRHDINRPIRFDGERLDPVLVLRRR